MSEYDKIRVGDRSFFDYIGVARQTIEAKPLIVVSDNKTKNRQLYPIHKSWLDFSKGTIMVPTAKTANI